VNDESPHSSGDGVGSATVHRRRVDKHAKASHVCLSKSMINQPETEGRLMYLNILEIPNLEFNYLVKQCAAVRTWEGPIKEPPHREFLRRKTVCSGHTISLVNRLNTNGHNSQF
jgi:hypothetical protein